MAIQLLLALLGLVLGLSLMIWLATAQGGSVVLGGMNGVVLGGVLGAILAGQVDRWMPPSR